MSCPEYPKIDTLYNRGDDFKVDTKQIRRPEFTIPHEWLVTEKIDGTNVRVSLEEEIVVGGPSNWVVRFYGRTKRTQMPTFLFDYLQRMFTLESMQALWRCKASCGECDGNGWVNTSVATTKFQACPNLSRYPIVLYGEGYGARIQKGGGNYRKDGDVSFRLIDALIGETWLRRADVEDVAAKLKIKTVPKLGIAKPTDEIVDLVKSEFRSSVAYEEGTPRDAEGVVAFTDPPLFNSRGKRLMWKLKAKDFTVGKR